MGEGIGGLLNNIKRLHFIGIGGSGMFPIVQILLSEGYAITGSDVDDNSDIVRMERGLGIKVNVPHEASAVDGADAVVVTAALFEGNPEVKRANELGIPIIKRSTLLGYVTTMYDNAFCISGTHGKTTATSMLTQILFDAGKDPAAVIGGKLPAIGGYGRHGKSDIMTCEACEYVDTFLELYPDYAVVLDIDRDHLDYFKTEQRLSQSFTKFASKATKAVIANGDDEKTVAAMQGVDKEIIYFGKGENCRYRIVDAKPRERSFYQFELIMPNNKTAHIELSAPGAHHVYNAAAAAACADIAGCTCAEIESGLRAFKGAGRRFEIIGENAGITIADDYAHHPREVEATLTAAKQMGFNRVWAVFQPFTFSRTKMLMNDFAKALSIADKVVMTKIMGAREVDDNTVHTSDLGRLIEGSAWFDSFGEVVEHTMKNAAAGDLVITLGCGDIYKAARLMLKYGK